MTCTSCAASHGTTDRVEQHRHSISLTRDRTVQKALRKAACEASFFSVQRKSCWRSQLFFLTQFSGATEPEPTFQSRFGSGFALGFWAGEPGFRWVPRGPNPDEAGFLGGFRGGFPPPRGGSIGVSKPPCYFSADRDSAKSAHHPARSIT